MDDKLGTNVKSLDSGGTVQLRSIPKESDDDDLGQPTETDEFKAPCLMCGVCGKTFSRIDNLRVHEKKHSAETAQTCADCGQKFSLKRYLDMHIASKHSGVVYNCSVPGCPKKFTTERSLKLHLLAHEGKFNFICNQCGKGFMRKGALNEHLAVHMGEKTFLCSNCGKQFRVLSSLKRHKDSCGVSTRGFTCPVCNKQFKTERYLKEHMVIHDDPKRYQCVVCGEEMSHRATLRKHMQRKHNCS